MTRIPRKKKKKLKALYKHRYGFSWLGCPHYDMVVMYEWFFKNPFKMNMYKSLQKNQNDRFRKIRISK